MKAIKKYPNYFVTEEGLVFSSKTNKFLKFSYDQQGYQRVGLYIGNYKSKTIKVHRLIAETFIDNPLNKKDVNHIDGDKSNNNIENLRWVTSRQNQHNRKSNNEHINISLTRHETYQVRIFSKRKCIFDKTFKTLSEAIEARDNFYVNNPEIK